MLDKLKAKWKELYAKNPKLAIFVGIVLFGLIVGTPLWYIFGGPNA